MKAIVRFSLIIVALLFININETRASHFAGSDLTYTHVSGNSYLITYTFYRDCSGISAPSTVVISFNCSSTPAFNFTSTLSQIANTGQEITSICPSMTTTCTTGNNYGIQEYIFQGTVTLPACNSWTMTSGTCCRNPVSTLIGQVDWTTVAYLNNTAAPGNSSPIFSGYPTSIVCSNQSFCFNQGAVDPDGDSLVYSLYAPFAIYPSSVSYQFPYSSTNFLSSSTPITINSATGDICFTPNAVLSAVLGVKVDEYRTVNGVATLIGTVYRDVQLKVIACTNNTPTISGIDLTMSSTYSVTDTIYQMDVGLTSDSIRLTIKGDDADVYSASNSGAPEKFSITWNNGINNATFSSYNNGTSSAYGRFAWKPAIADIGKLKCFVALVADSACPYAASQSYSYCFFVLEKLVVLGPDTGFCAGDSLEINASTGLGGSFLWTFNGDTLPNTSSNIVIDTAGIYTVEATSSSLTDYDTIVVTQNPMPIVTLTGLSNSYCMDDSPVSLLGSPANGIYFGNNISTNIFTPSATGPGYKVVNYRFTDVHMCTAMATTSTSVYPTPAVTFSGLSSNYCSNDQGSALVGFPSGGSFSGAGTVGNYFNPSLSGLGTQYITYALTNQYSCTGSRIDSVYIVGAPMSSLSTDTTICAGDSIELAAGANIAAPGLLFSSYIEGASLNKALELYNASSNMINLSEYRITQAQNGNGWSLYYYFPTGATLAPYSEWIMVSNLIDNNLYDTSNADAVLPFPSVIYFTGDDAIAIERSVDGGNTWFIMDVIGDPNNKPSVAWGVAGTANATKDYTLVRKPYVISGTTNWSTAAGTDSINSEYKVYPIDHYNLLGNHSVIPGPQAPTYFWSTGSQSSSIVVMPNVKSNYSVTIDNGVCQTLDSVWIDVKPYPVVYLGSDQTIYWTIGSLILDAGNPGATWNWSTGGTSQTEVINKSNTTIGVPNIIYVSVDLNGCESSDTVIISTIDDVSLSENENDIITEIYPNPSNGQFVMSIKGFIGNIQMELHDNAGQRIYIRNLDVTASYKKSFDFKTLPKGVYYIRLSNEDFNKVQKLVIQ